MVSDGLTVVRTDADGSFSFPERADAEFVFVTVPSSHQALEQGWFASLRDEDDSKLRLELTPREGGAKDGCRFVQVTDLHVSVDGGARLQPMIHAGVVSPPGIIPTGEVSGEELRADLELIVEREAPDFVAATGDLADYGQEEELDAYREAITGLGVPVASVPGNHDHLSVLSREAITEFFATWKQEDTPDLGPGDAFQRAVFGGDWRRPKSGRAPWRDVIGPLYYSFDWGGVHFVAYDGEGLRRYGEDYPQDEWLANDLAAIDSTTPVVVLTHFPESAEFYRSRFGNVRLMASLCGHWHATRHWQDGDAHHWTSSTVGFGGIDYTPRGYRVVEVDAEGARSRWETVESTKQGARRVTGAGGTADRLVFAFEAPDASGAIAVPKKWEVPLRAAARGGLVVTDGLVFSIDSGSTLRSHDAKTGDERWSHQLGDRSVRMTFGLPTIVGSRLYVGSAMSVHAFVAESGSELWRRDISPDDWAASWSGVAADAEIAVIGALNDHLHLAALDAGTGEIRWIHDGRDIAGVSATPVLLQDRVLAARAPGWLQSFDRGDGKMQWEQPLDDAWPVALASARGLAFVRSSTGQVTAHDVQDGAQRWSIPLGPGLRASRPYSRERGGSRVPLVVFGPHVWTATADALVGIDLETGEITTRTQTDGEIVTVLGDGPFVLGVTADAHVVRAQR
jgi:outer membrane protein assembly factor BamB/predicted MPP superfamily phosphohydrolase